VTASGNLNPDPTARLLSRLATLPGKPPPLNQAEAAVLILLRNKNAGLEVLAEQRAERPGDPWSGQVGLPGGHKKPEDRSLEETVLREMHEEVGVLPSDLEGSPRAFDVRRARPSGLRVAVFVARVTHIPEDTSRVDPQEVATTFWLPLKSLDRTETRPRATIFGEINVDTVVFEGHVVWGFTLRVLLDFIQWLGASDTSDSEPRGAVRRWRSQAV
jgi:8-oxo-dGTP pyrophosphatase MutT (NUDIX family)